MELRNKAKKKAINENRTLCYNLISLILKGGFQVYINKSVHI